MKNIRLVTTTKGYSIIKEESEKTVCSAYSSIIDFAEINKQYEDMVYLGWKGLFTEQVDFLERMIFELEWQDVTYKMSIMEEIDTGLASREHISKSDELKAIPTPCIQFNDEEITKELENYVKGRQEIKRILNMYRSDERLITFDRGVDILKQQIEESKDEFIINSIKNVSINKSADDIVYLGWNKLNNYCVQFLKDKLYILKRKNITHSMAIIQENSNNIENYNYIATKDKSKNIFTLAVDRLFNENEVETFFKNYEKQIDTIEY